MSFRAGLLFLILLPLGAQASGEAPLLGAVERYLLRETSEGLSLSSRLLGARLGSLSEAAYSRLLTRIAEPELGSLRQEITSRLAAERQAFAEYRVSRGRSGAMGPAEALLADETAWLSKRAGTLGDRAVMSKVPAVVPARVRRATWRDYVATSQEARARAPLSAKNLVFNHRQALISIMRSESDPFAQAMLAAHEGINDAKAVAELADDLDRLARKRMQQSMFGLGGDPLMPVDYDSYLGAFKELAAKEGMEVASLPARVPGKWASVTEADGMGRCCNREGFRHYVGEMLARDKPAAILDPVANFAGHPAWIHAFQELLIIRKLRTSALSNPLEFFRMFGRRADFSELWFAALDDGPGIGVFNSPVVLSQTLENLGMPVRYEGAVR